jgi:hypothetical protein
MTDGGPRFCPFCKDAFDDVARCPSHDVELVSLRELARLAAVAGDDDAPVSIWSPRRGRGWLACGALLMLAAFFCPLASLHGELTVTNTLFSLARGRALRLWIVPMAAFALLSLLYRRRTAYGMRGARLAAVFVSLLPGAVVLFTLHGAQQAALRLAEELRSDFRLQIGLGAWLVALATIPALWGSVMLGKRPATRVR